LTLGAPAPASTWTYPDGIVDDGVDERLEVYNPGDRAAQVQVAVTLDRGSAEPLSLTVAPRGRASVAMASEGRIPKGIAHATVVSSTNGVPVVAERIITTTPPSPRSGISDTAGSPAAARQWVFPAGEASSAWDEWLVLYNPGPLATDVHVVATSAGTTLPSGAAGALTLAAGERRAQRLGDVLSAPEIVLSIDAVQPVVAERDLYRTGAPGLSAAIGIIGSDGPS
jgi:hypothetical protein